MRRYNIGFIICLVAIFWSATSYALQVSIDQFTIIRNGSTFFTDDFTDGDPPPTGVGSLIYGVFGSIPNSAESGGKLQLDSANGLTYPNAPGAPRLNVNVTLLTDTSSNIDSGLKSDDTLRLTGIFDLMVPTGPLFSAYGIRFIDMPLGGTLHQMLQLFVRFNDVTGQAEIAYILQDYDDQSITTFGAVPLGSFIPAGADQIMFFIDRPVANSDNFIGHFEFLQGGVGIGGQSYFNTPGQMFDGENFVRAQFFVAEGVPAVPEPATMLLLGSGLIGLAGYGRKKFLKK